MSMPCACGAQEMFFLPGCARARSTDRRGRRVNQAEMDMSASACCRHVAQVAEADGRDQRDEPHGRRGTPRRCWYETVLLSACRSPAARRTRYGAAAVGYSEARVQRYPSLLSATASAARASPSQVGGSCAAAAGAALRQLAGRQTSAIMSEFCEIRGESRRPGIDGAGRRFFFSGRQAATVPAAPL